MVGPSDKDRGAKFGHVLAIGQYKIETAYIILVPSAMVRECSSVVAVKQGKSQYVYDKWEMLGQTYVCLN